jgi:hypothetical protein
MSKKYRILNYGEHIPENAEFLTITVNERGAPSHTWVKWTGGKYHPNAHVGVGFVNALQDETMIFRVPVARDAIWVPASEGKTLVIMQPEGIRISQENRYITIDRSRVDEMIDAIKEVSES